MNGSRRPAPGPDPGAGLPAGRRRARRMPRKTKGMRIGSPALRPTSCLACAARGSTEWCELPEDDLRLLSQSKVSNVYRPGQVVFYQGQPCLGLHCIESGTVALRKTDAQGASVIARLFHAGQTLGYLAYFARRPYTGTAEAVTECRICFIDKAAVRAIVSRNPGVAQRFLGRIADNLSEAEDARLAVSTMPLRARLAELLVSVRERFGAAGEDGTITLRLPLSRQDIAAMLGARPESLSRAIRELSGAGVAVFDGRDVTIPDLDALIDEVEQAGGV